MVTEEEKYMHRCIQLAKNGIGHVSPNPTVGAVIVCDGKIIGEGYHVLFGKEHAEVNAIRSVKDESLLKRSTIYVSLEPCSHFGKTPPCADLIIKKQIPRVVIGCLDPFSKVSGRGILKLKDVGINVETNVLEKECKTLINKFIVFNTQQRPYISLKWAESADNYIDTVRTEGTPTILSSPLTSMFVHKKRTEVDAIMVGTRTALLDNPSLNVRNWSGKNPIRIVLDKELRLPENLHLFDNQIKTLVFTSRTRASSEMIEYISLDYRKNILPQILTSLYERGIQSLLVEGGSILLQSFIDNSLWDEAYIEKSPVLLHKGVKAPALKEAGYFSEEQLFGIRFQYYRNEKS